MDESTTTRRIELLRGTGLMKIIDVWGASRATSAEHPVDLRFVIVSSVYGSPRIGDGFYRFSGARALSSRAQFFSALRHAVLYARNVNIRIVVYR
jgi:hypothetical protein